MSVAVPFLRLSSCPTSGQGGRGLLIAVGMEQVKLIQLNCHNAYQTGTELGLLMAKSSSVIAFLQEPYTAFGKVAMVPKGLSLHAGDGGDLGPRAAVLVPRRLQALTVEHLCTRDSAVVSVRLQGRTVLVASVYMDSTLPVIQPWLEDIFAFAEQKDLP